MTRRVAINHEVLLSIRRSKHWGRSELVLEGLKTFLTFISPLKLDAFVKQISHRSGNLRIFFDKTATITSPRKLRTCLTVLGGVQSRIAWIHSGVTAMPSLEITCPRYVTSGSQNSHLEYLA